MCVQSLFLFGADDCGLVLLVLGRTLAVQELVKAVCRLTLLQSPQEAGG